jgi:hypothetical protein
VDRQQLLDGFDFNDDLAFGNDIQSINALQPDALANQRNRDLADNADTCLLQLETQAFLVGLFEQPGPELLVDVDC